jgi:RES domain-containing protein
MVGLVVRVMCGERPSLYLQGDVGERLTAVLPCGLGVVGSSAMPAFKSWDSFRTFADGVRKQQRFAQDAASRGFLGAVRKTSRHRATILRKGHALWRAQVGFDWARHEIDDEDFIEVPGPYRPERMVPDPAHVGDGRANPKGIAYMYLSEKRNTALAEVRPWVGAYVSVAVFEILRDLKLVDCTAGHSGLVFQWEAPKPSKWDAIVWQDIDRAFASPVNPHDPGTTYVPTQVLAEVFRDQGYDGIVYRSTLGAGRNLLVFDAAATNLVSCLLFRVNGVEYSATEASNPYSRPRKTQKPQITTSRPRPGRGQGGG